MRRTIDLLIICIAVLSAAETRGQIGVSSPYTSRGLGYLNESLSVPVVGMSGVSLGLRDPQIINFTNPASYTAFDSLSFVFEGGFYMNSTSLRTTDFTEESTSASMTHLLFGFPITRWWKSSFGLLPYSQVGYQVFSDDISDDVGKVRHRYEGSGGVNQFYFGNGFKPFEFLSVGVNVAYLFGTIEKYQYISFPDSIYYLGTKTSNLTTIGDFAFNFGLQGHIPLKNDLRLNIGATFNLGNPADARRDYLAQTYLGTVNNIETIVDTVQISMDEAGVIDMPAGYGAGVMLEKKDKWRIGFDFKQENWSQLKIYGEDGRLSDSYRFALGGEFAPDKLNGIRYYERMDYRLGAFYSQTSLNIRDRQLHEFGITFGLGLPVIKSKSMINFAFEIGRRGTMEEGLIREDFMELSVGISVYEFWFFKRRYY